MATDGQLQIFTLPGYSPELNPDEWVWKNVKADRVGRAGAEVALACRSSLLETPLADADGNEFCLILVGKDASRPQSDGGTG